MGFSRSEPSPASEQSHGGMGDGSIRDGEFGDGQFGDGQFGDGQFGDGQIGDKVARLTVGGLDRRAQGKAIGSLTKALATSARGAGRASVLGGRWITDLLIDLAPRLPLRDVATLRAQHPGLGREDLAETLITGAAKATAAVGAAGGALAAVEFAAAPTLLSAPAQIAAETLLVAAVEIKLIAELHELYDAGVAGTAAQRGSAYLLSWTNRRGIDPLAPGAMGLAMGGATKRLIRRRLIRRAGRNLATMGPLMSGAVAGSMVNHRETRRIGADIRGDLRSASG